LIGGDNVTIGERMKARRKEIGFSAEKVAELLGVSPATIYRYEKGDIEKVPGDKLAPIADVLCTTPAYLMGWSEKASAPLVSTRNSNDRIPAMLLKTWCTLDDSEKQQFLKMLQDGPLSDDDLKLLSRYHLLTHDNQIRILERIESLLEDQPSKEEKQPSAG